MSHIKGGQRRERMLRVVWNATWYVYNILKKERTTEGRLRGLNFVLVFLPNIQ